MTPSFAERNIASAVMIDYETKDRCRLRYSMTTETEDILRIRHGLLIGQSIEICSRRDDYGPEEGDQDAVLTSVLLQLRSRAPDPSLSNVQNDSINKAASWMVAVWETCSNWESHSVLRPHLNNYRRLVADTLTRNDRATQCVMLGTALGRSEGWPPPYQSEDGRYPETLMNERFWSFESPPEIRRLLATLQIPEDIVLRTGLSPLDTKLSPEFEEKTSGYPVNRWGWGVLDWNLREFGAVPLPTENSRPGRGGNPFGVLFGDNNSMDVTRPGEDQPLRLKATPWNLFFKLTQSEAGITLDYLQKIWKHIGRSERPSELVVRKQISNVRVALKKKKWSLTINEVNDESGVVFRLTHESHGECDTSPR